MQEGGLEDDCRRLYELLSGLSDQQGIVRYEPVEVGHRLGLETDTLEVCLHDLYVCGMVIYVTRRNKETGDELKIVQVVGKSSEPSGSCMTDCGP